MKKREIEGSDEEKEKRERLRKRERNAEIDGRRLIRSESMRERESKK